MTILLNKTSTHLMVRTETIYFFLLQDKNRISYTERKYIGMQEKSLSILQVIQYQYHSLLFFENTCVKIK